MSALFTAKDFPHSEFINGDLSSDDDVYPDWAARQANLVLDRAAEGHSFDELLAELAASRAALESRLRRSRPDEGKFGRPRRVWSYTVIGNWANLSSGPHATGPLRASILRRLVRYRYPEEACVGGKRVRKLRLFAELLDGRRLPANAVFEGMEAEWLGHIGVEHSPVETVEALMGDARLLAGADDPVSLGRALWCYHQAMPFERGSAAIGRSFWAGWWTARLGRKVVFPDDVDLWAMIEPQSGFISWLVSRLDDPNPVSFELLTDRRLS